MKQLAPLIFCIAAACGGSSASSQSTAHSSSMALTADGKTLYVVNADADTISVIDTGARTLIHEIALGPTPAVNGSGDYVPAVMPRAVALSADEKTLYATGERSGSLYAIDVPAGTVRNHLAVGSEPISVLVSADDGAIWVTSSQDNHVVRVDPKSLQATLTLEVPAKPWALAWSPTGHLLVSHFLRGAVTDIDPVTLQVAQTWSIPNGPARGDRKLAHGEPRGLYDLATKPGSQEVWVAHAMLGTDTAQPQLDFESTAFPSLSLLTADGTFERTLSTDAPDVPGVDGQITDVVSGPHAIAFTKDGRYALVVDSNSEDVLAIDTNTRVEATLLRPLPGHLPEGIVLSPDEKLAYVDERNTGDVVVITLDRKNGLSLSIDGAPIPRLGDPMPAPLRLGQHLFYSANSDEVPITKNHWVACATCHMEGRSDAVTWLFAQGPRDTPTNAGGTIGTGFLFRTADRTKVQDYWHTINIEQGGTFDPVDPVLAPLLDRIADYTNHGIPLPVPPTTEPALVAQGKEIFERQDVGCSGCHAGPRYTDSGGGNPSLDLAGFVLLHDVGTCVSGGTFPDVAHMDVDGNAREACLFDTPSLSGLADSGPYLHDGSATAIRDVLEQTRGKMGNISSLSEPELVALVEFLRSL